MCYVGELLTRIKWNLKARNVFDKSDTEMSAVNFDSTDTNHLIFFENSMIGLPLK